MGTLFTDFAVRAFDVYETGEDECHYDIQTPSVISALNCYRNSIHICMLFRQYHMQCPDILTMHCVYRE